MSSHNQRPTIRQLEYLVAAAEEASMSRAAQRCHVTQPTLSSQIRQLELRIGQDLFERTPRGVFPTPAGKDLVQLAREAIEAVDQLLVRANAPDRPLEGRIKLGSLSTITPYLVPEALAELEQSHPELQIELHDGSGDEIKAKLTDGSVDAILVALPTGLHGTEEIELAFDPFLLVAPAGSTLGDLAEPVQVESLGASKLLLLDDPHCVRGQALEVCMRANSSPDTSLHVTSISALVQLVRQGLGATLLPSLALDLEQGWLDEIRLKTFADPAPGRHLAMAWRSGSSRSSELRMLAEVFMRHATRKTRQEFRSQRP